MQRVLSPDELKEHVVLKYDFRKLEVKPSNTKTTYKQMPKAILKNKFAQDNSKRSIANKRNIESVVDKIEQQNKSLQESLLKRIDELNKMLSS